MTGLGISLTVNAAVTGLIALRILKMYKEVNPTVEHRNLGNGGPAGGRLRCIMFIIIESGMAMFTIQLIWVVLTTILQNDAFYISVGINDIFNVIIHSLVISTFILLRLFLGNHTHHHPLGSVHCQWVCLFMIRNPWRKQSRACPFKLHLKMGIRFRNLKI